MPTILEILGWRLFFYANEGNEPIHVHAWKGESECQYWLDLDDFDIMEACAFNLSPRDRRQIRKIIFDHFDYLVEQWASFKGDAWMQKVNDIQKLSFEDGHLHLQVDGREYTFNLADISPSLLRASAEERMRYENPRPAMAFTGR